MKTLLLIPSKLKSDIHDDVMAGRHPTMDYHALAAALEDGADNSAETLDYRAVECDQNLWVRLVRKAAGCDAALALMGFQRRKAFDAIFTNGENVGIPLALLLKLLRRRPGHVTIGHRLSTGKKHAFFTALKVHNQIDSIFVYAQTQFDFAEKHLGVPAEKLNLIPFHADDQFYRPQTQPQPVDNQICSAGLEWRDYPTLIDAVAEIPDLQVKLAAASPWSKHTDETANRTLPPNVEARRYEYRDLRALYAGSAFVVVPLYDNDFQAGITTILEAMAMGKAVIATHTTGQTDVITDGENGLYVAPGDVAGMRTAITRLRSDTALRSRLARNGRLWVERNASLSRWVVHMATALQASQRPPAPKALPNPAVRARR